MNISVLNGIIGVVILLVGVTLIRYVWFTEKYFTKCYQKLVDNDFVFKQDLIWDIYDVVDGTPAVFRYRNGVNAVFVAFDKDIIIGRDIQNEYNHYEAIATAYQYAAQKGIAITHIDYMDVVGKDDRMTGVINNMLKTPNEDLQQLLAAIFEYQQFRMNRVYASYDVYAFYYKGDDHMFMSELDTVISKFMEANFIHYKYLDVKGIREPVKAIYNLPEFSVYKACDRVLSKSSVKKFIRVRKTFKDGVMTVVSKTNREQDEERYLREREKVERSREKVEHKRSGRGSNNQVFEPTDNFEPSNNFEPMNNFESAPNYLDDNDTIDW